MSMELIKAYRDKVEHHFDLLSIYMPHLFTKEGLRSLAEEDLDALTEDVKLSLAAKIKDMYPYDADSYFGVPFVSYYHREVPTKAPQYESEHGVQLYDYGNSVAKVLFEIIFQRFSSGDEKYFQKYHGVVCVRQCQSALECSEIRKLVLEREELEEELDKIANIHAPDLWAADDQDGNADPDSLDSSFGASSAADSGAEINDDPDTTDSESDGDDFPNEPPAKKFKASQ